MDLRLWQFGTDNQSIPSFLGGMSVAHNEPIRTEEWFHWKFEQSPYGKAIMACAFDGKRVAGCVAYGLGIVRYQGKDWTCALSYETFVHPDYQGKGLFKKLIALAEQEMGKQGIQFLYNYPNANSILGFKHMNWICRNDVRCFKLKPINIFRVLFRFQDLKKFFRPAPSNIDQLRNIRLADFHIAAVANPDIITPVWTKEYIEWRFFTFPNREYFVSDNEEYFAISMVGSRGSLKSAHILFAMAKNCSGTELIMGKVVKAIKNEINPDIIEYASSVMDRSLDRVFGFFRVPSHGNFCYKVLDNKMKIDEFKIVLPSINAHTY